MKEKKKRGRGRPKGFKMKECSKKAIALSKTGYVMSEETKKKISDGVRRAHEVGAPIEVLMEADLEKCGQFKNGEYISIGIPNPVFGEPSYQQRLHVAIMEQFLGRKLKRQEEIHHWGNKDDNRFEMLALCKTRREHMMLDKIKNRTLKGELKKIENLKGGGGII